MSWLKVNEKKSGFLLDGIPFFYLADTVWSAFTNITMEEWEYYLKHRKEQGFTVLQINTLPQWDRCMSDVGLYPFATKDGAVFDFTKWDDRYYERAKKMCEMAVKDGFQLALVVLWLNFVPDTWGSRINGKNVMPKEFIYEYTKKVVSVFDSFQPIYIVSGDTDFKTSETEEYYQIVLDTLCEQSPSSLKAFHICRGSDIIPERFLDQIDFYMFQSGHNKAEQHMAYRLPEIFREKYPKKPMLNAEPCYEQMGYSRQIYGRFQKEDVRRAAWNSILAGACAGITYGAHGIWNWQKINKPANPVLGEGFDAPFEWQQAIQFPGAWDYGWIRMFLETIHAGELTPANELLKNRTEEIRVAQTENKKWLIYLPHSTKVVLERELTGYRAWAVDLEKKRCAVIDCQAVNGNTVIALHPFENDTLLVLESGIEYSEK